MSLLRTGEPMSVSNSARRVSQPPSALPASPDARLDRMPTGIPGLDHLLDGGLVRANSLLIEGSPGSGKSTLATQILYEGIQQFGEPGLIITFEEFPKQLYADAMQFGMDLERQERDGKLRVVWTPPERILGNFTGRIDLIDRIVEEMHVRRLVIDSITHFKRVATDETKLREILGCILNNLKIKGVNAVLVKELERMDSETIAFEEYLVDASLRLYELPNPGGGENVRTIEVRKTRGQPHVSGQHPFQLDGGVRIFPRLRPADIEAKFRERPNVERKRVPMGSHGIDTLLDGGLWNGSLNLISGQPGTGKSVVAYHFLNAGLEAGENTMLLSIKSPPDEIMAQAKSLNMDWSNAYDASALRILHHPPVGLCVEEMLDSLVRAIVEQRPARLVFDSIDDLWSAVKNADRVRDYIVGLTTLFRASGTTSVLLNQVRRLHGDHTGDVDDYAYLANTVLRLRVDRDFETLTRYMWVEKHAGSNHPKKVFAYDIDENGIRVRLERLSADSTLGGGAQVE